ncbi:hypothetical protein Q7P37_006854 [Cladosporium fusiforme]
MSLRRPSAALQHSSSPSAPHRVPPRASSNTTLRDNYNHPDRTRSSPPATPRNPDRRSRKGKGKEPVRPHTSKHSHGESWSSTTRDSVVDNLLMSLDELSMQMKGTFDSAPLYAAMGRTPSRSRGHTYSSSMSSDFDRRAAHDSTSSNLGSPPQKSRRSNSSSNFNTFATPKQGRSQPPTSKYNGHGRGRTDSESEPRRNHSTPNKYVSSHHREDSQLSIADLGYDAVLESSRLAFNGRSISMDQIYGEANSSRTTSMMNRGRPVPSVNSKYELSADAAPEPTIAAGPRKQENPSATGPVFVNAAQKQSSLRKTTTQSDLRSANNNSIPQGIRDQASEFVRSNGLRGESVANCSSDAKGNGSRRKEVSPQRDRPGFFKRVFGGSSTRLPAVEPPQAQNSPSMSRAQSSAQRDAPQQPSDTSTGVSHPPGFVKQKTFVLLQEKEALNLGEHSAACYTDKFSSLREVMDSYLNKMETPAKSNLQHETASRSVSRNSRIDSRQEDSDDLELFHSGYTPPADASLGARNPLSRHGTLRLESEGDSPSTKMKVKKRRPEPVPSASAPDVVTTAVFNNANGGSSAEVSPLTVVHPSSAKISPLSVAFPRAEAGNSRPVSPVSRASTGDRIIAYGAGAGVDPNQEVRDFPADHNGESYMHNQSQLTTHDTLHAYDRPGTKTTHQPNVGEEQENKSGHAPSSSDSLPSPSQAASMKLPTIFAAVRADPAQYHNANTLPIVQLDGNDAPRPSVDTIGFRESNPNMDDNEDVKERARRIFEGNEEDVTRMEAAAWLGELKLLSRRTLDAYMQLFDFTGMNVLSTLRALCGKLVLKGETQQFDRIITALSARWCECNPNHGFKAQDVVHTIFYSLILLNTDLHMADIGEKMSKNAYVKNTLPTVRRVVLDAAPNAFDDATLKSASGAQSRPSVPWMDSSTSVPTGEVQAPDQSTERTSLDMQRPTMSKRLSIRPGMFRAESDGFVSDSSTTTSSNALVSTPWSGSMRMWEFEIETALKSFYSSIKIEPLPLLDLAVADVRPPERNLNVAGLKRTGSVISKAPSEATSYRSKAGIRGLAMGWQSRNNRSRQKVYPSSTIGSSRTSFDDNSSLYSPAQSSTWSKNSYARTLTSTSVGSLGYHLTPTDTAFKHSIGFANALSQAIIREEGGTNMDTDSVTLKQDLLEDESLTLEGAPWAKEGLVKHKHHLEGPERKSRDRHWSECFAVISKGKLTLFNFNTGTSKSYSLGRARLQKGTSIRAPSITNAQVGGGDWTENAEQLDSFALRQTIASTLPPPGYSKARPHVWALSLPSGAVHLFQVGTPEIAQEWMSTANYWSARLSKEPLSGGVSNIEYGWSEAVINPALLERTSSITSNTTVPVPPPSIRNRPRGHTHTSSNGGGRPSIQSSVRSSFDNMAGGTRHKMPSDKIQITDWQPPSQSMMASQLMEVDQLKSLQTYVANVEAELESHNELKHGIELAYSFRASNYYKAMSNWQRKSEYLLREIVKFRTYIESLTAAGVAKEEVLARRAERDAELAVIRSNAAAAVAAANHSDDDESTKTALEAVEVLPMDDDDDDDNDKFEEAVESRDITPRQSAVSPAPVPVA